MNDEENALVEESSGAVGASLWTANVLVTKVRVMILDEQGKALEQGEATPVMDAVWEYIPANEGKVLVEAGHLAGNVTRQVF
jgi:ABC-type cobalamin/Fe3+-siderophores transport system ATPase subunit